MIKFIINPKNTPDIIKYPIITTKTIQLLEENKYSFLVNLKSTKNSIKQSIESLFSVKVLQVNTSILSKQDRSVNKFKGYKAQYKKAIVTLAKENRIDLFKTN